MAIHEVSTLHGGWVPLQVRGNDWNTISFDLDWADTSELTPTLTSESSCSHHRPDLAIYGSATASVTDCADNRIAGPCGRLLHKLKPREVLSAEFKVDSQPQEYVCSSGLLHNKAQYLLPGDSVNDFGHVVQEGGRASAGFGGFTPGFGYPANFGQAIVDFSRAIPDFGHPVPTHNPIFFDGDAEWGFDWTPIFADVAASNDCI